MRFTGTSSAFDSALADRPSASSSSRNISPGCSGRIPFATFMASTSSVIIHDLHIAWPIVFPAEANSPLRVDPYAVLAGPVAAQRFQPVARQTRKVVEGFGTVQIGTAAHGLIGEPLERRDAITLEETPSIACGP